MTNIVTRRKYRIHYNLKNADGKIVDTSQGGEPLEFVEGDGKVVVGLEQALSDRRAGDIIEVTVPPALGYGVFDEAKRYHVPKSSFESSLELRRGLICQVLGDGQHFAVRVLEVKGEQVLVDANHPLAGIALCFEVQILSVDTTKVDLKD